MRRPQAGALPKRHCLFEQLQPLACRQIAERLPPQRLIIGRSVDMPATPAAAAFISVAKDYFKKIVPDDGVISSV